MASFVYAVLSITNVASVHCAARPEISPCTCEPTFAHNYVDLSCEKVDSFHKIVDALSNKFDPNVKVNLKISHSQLEDLEMRSFMDMKLNLVKLRMQFNGLRSVPELPFRGLSNVEFLSLADNELEEIPKHMLNHMPIIKTLDMGKCRIRAVLQDDFKGTQMLTNLFISVNNITRVDRTTFPPALVVLHLGHNQIEYLNGTLRHLNKLESLFINMNNISNLENELPETNRLKLILAHNNRLERLPESIRFMDKLEGLQVQHNHLTTLNGVLRNAVNLIEFHAFNNKIKSLARNEFEMATKLGEIYFAHNQIKSLNGSLLPLQMLHRANFSYNLIEEFSIDEIRGLLSLRQLDLSNNHITKLCGRQENHIDKNSYLVEFYLDYNELKTLDGALMGLNSLRILGLTHNQIERILPEDFIGLEKLEILELSHNKLLTLTEMQTTVLPSLKILKVDYNNLTILDKDFHGLPVLCQANLTSNNIQHISRDLVAKTRCINHNVPGKLELFLEDNPLSCNSLLEEFCSVMLDPERRVRLRTKCFEVYEDLCKMLIVLPPKSIIPLLNDQLKRKADELLPPLLAPLGQPSIKTSPVMNSINLLEAANVDTDTTTNLPTTSTTTTIPATVPAEILQHIESIYSAEVNDTLIDSLLTHGSRIVKATTPGGPSATTTTTPIPTSLISVYNFDHVRKSEEKLGTIPITRGNNKEEALETGHNTTPSILVFNIADPQAKQIAINSKISPIPKAEYSTMEYIPAVNNVGNQESPLPHPANILIDENSQVNSLPEDYHSKVLPNINNAPQSLLMPEDPPENP
ncbi:leucine-rich repeat-containing larval translucida isoform 1-T1 [Glossina fuscipes fuscipes]